MLVRAGKAAKVVVSRIGWSGVGVALSATIIAAAVYILLHVLRDLELHGVIAAVRAIGAPQIAGAGCAVAAAYGTLTFYDLFALRTIGANHVPYRIAALASFTSYSIGHNIGATAFTGGAIRYRIYSHWGLRVIDVAKVCFVTGLTFWLGNLTVLGLGMAYEPQAASLINHLPHWTNRMIGLAAICALCGYVTCVWSKPRSFGRNDWRVTLPGGPSTLVQITIGIADLLFCALAMYVLMPHETPLDFVTLAVIFISATLLGFASHAPGSLGVFDAAMLVALASYHKEEVVAGLLLFRLIYFVIPFSLALLIMGCRELWLMLARRAFPTR